MGLERMKWERGFRIIPVLDLKDGLIVRGIRGERSTYRAVQSRLTPSPEFSAVLKAFYEGFDFTEFYIADLDAIISGGEKNHLQLITGGRKLTVREKSGNLAFSFLVDAGIREAADVAGVLKAGIQKVIVGTETLRSVEALREMVVRYGAERLVASIDTQEAKVIGASPELNGGSPVEVIGKIGATGVQNFILLQLGKVGTGEGLDKPLIQACLAALTEKNGRQRRLLVGGGIAGREDLKWLKANGAAGALVASVLHDGRLKPDAVRALQDEKALPL
jgi:phosphoribosylformimino-5-aminoimidazole carboxamide ribotide isomerase